MPHIWEAHTYGDHRSPMALFEDDGKLKEVLTQILDAGNVPNATKLRCRLRYYRLTGVYNFRPSAAKALVDRYCPPGALVWDPCAGWGGRLMGASLSSNKVRYIGCDPSSGTVRGLHELKTWMDEYVPGLDRRVEIYPVPAEDFDPPSGLDLVLTSPPYWKREHYSDEDTQSANRYPNYHVWLDNFWRPVLSKAVRALKVGGWLALNVDDFTINGVHYSFIEDTVRIVESLGLKETERLTYEVPSPVKKANTEVVLSFCNVPEAVPHPTSPTPIEVVEPEKQPKARVIHIHICPVCKKKYETLRRDTVYCTGVCAARVRRRRQKDAHKLKGYRDVTCQDCEGGFQIPVTGGVPKRCPKCAAVFKETDDLERRTKRCSYRECGWEFVDYSSNNSSKFCCEEHRRREKLLRLGKVDGAEQFRLDDPVSPGSRVRLLTCRLCGEKFEKKGDDLRNRCPTCLDKRREKVCRRCGSQYRDESVNNTRRYCNPCQNHSNNTKR